MASRYWVNGGNGLWNSTTNWSATSGGSSGASVPVTADDVYFDANGNSDSTISANITVRSFIVEAGYTSTITHDALLTIQAGNWTFNNSHTIAGSSNIDVLNLTINLNGQSWPNSVTFRGTTFTLNSDLVILGSLLVVSSFGNSTVNTSGGFKIFANGLSTTAIIGGTAEIELTGGTWISPNINGAITSNLRLNGNITISGIVNYRTGTLTYVSGTITTTGSSVRFLTCILDTNGISFNDVTLFGTLFTLNSNLTVLGTLSVISSAGNSVTNTSVGAKIFTSSLAMTAQISGTAEIEITGGTWSGAGAVLNNLKLNGNITISGTVNYRTGTLTYVSGTITTTGSLLSLLTCTLDTAGMSWNNVTVFGTVFTLNSDLNISGILSVISSAGNSTFNTSVGAKVFTNGLSMTANLAGNSEVVLTGGTWLATGVNGIVNINLTFDGNSTVSGIVYFQNKILKYTAGTVITAGSTLIINTNCIIDTNGMSWNNISFTNSSLISITIDSLLRIMGTLLISSNISFIGVVGWETEIFLCNVIDFRTITFKESIEYKINALLDVFKSRNGNQVSFRSGSLTIKSILTLKQGAQCKTLAEFIRIDSSNGRTINTFSGTVTDCINVRQFFDLGTVGSPI